MALEFIAAIVAAFAMAGIAMALRKLSGGRLPKWIVPVFAGLGLIGFAIQSEYSWYGRTAAELPEGVVVVATMREPMPLRPWTFLFPFTSQFSALDTRSLAAHPTAAGLVMAPIYSFARWAPMKNAVMVFDCAGNRQVAVREGMQIDSAGTLTGAEWVSVSPEDGFQSAACRAG